MIRERLLPHLTIRRDFWLRLVVLLVGLHGLFVIATTLLDQFAQHAGGHIITRFDVDIPLLIGLGLVYLSTLLRRRKRTAWVVAVSAYIFMIGFYAEAIEATITHHDWLQVVAKLGLPVLNILLLALFRKSFTVRSDIGSFGYSLRFIVIILLAAFLYGIGGFMLMDKHDFHSEVNFGTAVRQTASRFLLSSDGVGLVPRTRRAHLFVNSLSVISVGTVGFAVISLFQPIRTRYHGHRDTAEAAKALLEHYGGNSEDFFKLWPEDKGYMFDVSHQACLAYRVQRGVALTVGDPVGKPAAAKALLADFDDLCYSNDWAPAFVHATPAWGKRYEARGYRLQKIGEEAVVDLAHFNSEVRRNKYFRQIENRFQREGFTREICLPPHSTALLQRLRSISDNWLDKPGRVERGFMMGYFDEIYMQECTLVIARDSAGTIQGFLNRIPSYDPEEANFDLLRHASTSPGNINDYLLLGLIDHAVEDNLLRLNLGLCPLAGMDDADRASALNRALHFLYSNGDRFYSFSGLRRFKGKYEPEWQDRYVAYKGSPATLARVMTALTRALRYSKKTTPRKTIPGLSKGA